MISPIMRIISMIMIMNMMTMMSMTMMKIMMMTKTTMMTKIMMTMKIMMTKTMITEVVAQEEAAEAVPEAVIRIETAREGLLLVVEEIQEEVPVVAHVPVRGQAPVLVPGREEEEGHPLEAVLQEEVLLP